MIFQALAWIVFFTNALSSEVPEGSFGYKYCSIESHPSTGIFNCPPHWTCKHLMHSKGFVAICVSKLPHDPVPCSTSRDCDAHRNYVCAAWPKNGRYMGYCTIALKEFYCKDTADCKKEEICVVSGRPEHGEKEHGVCKPESENTVEYCTKQKCRKGEKCAASGSPDHGVCKPESDPTGEYCSSTKDCRWYALETCNDRGECIKRYY